MTTVVMEDYLLPWQHKHHDTVTLWATVDTCPAWFYRAFPAIFSIKHCLVASAVPVWSQFERVIMFSGTALTFIG